MFYSPAAASFITMLSAAGLPASLFLANVLLHPTGMADKKKLEELVLGHLASGATIDNSF
jgi:hypothetical protein